METATRSRGRPATFRPQRPKLTLGLSEIDLGLSEVDLGPSEVDLERFRSMVAELSLHFGRARRYGLTTTASGHVTRRLTQAREDGANRATREAIWRYVSEELKELSLDGSERNDITADMQRCILPEDAR